MRTVTIMPPDGAVYVDGEAFKVDTTGLEFHAIQWNEELQRGEIEYASTICPTCLNEHKKPNERITDFTPYQHFVTAWEQSKIATAEENERRRAEILVAMKGEVVENPTS